MKLLAYTLIATIAATSSFACDQAQARARLELAMSSGLIETFSHLNGVSTVHFRQNNWDRLDAFERLGVFGTMECFVAGPGKALSAIQAVNEGGRVLATFNGRTRQMDIR